MLTSINPSVKLKLKDCITQGLAVAFKWLLPLVKEFGGSYPPEDRIRRDVTQQHNLALGTGKMLPSTSTRGRMAHV